ncbi:MAG: hypothetical protein IJD49_03380 [Clostridia bacterium]|nr:hypothetical protein [Clostridia bacterium]
MKTKKTFKSVIAMLLAVILSFGAMSSAFAANVGEIIEWPSKEEYELIDEYVYKGELVEGSNAVKEEDPGYYDTCYTFEAEKSGYYTFSRGYGLSIFVSEAVADGKPSDYATTISAQKGEGDSAEYTLVTYLNAGTAYVAVRYYTKPVDDEIVIEYIGEELVDVEIDEALLQNLVMYYDFGYGSGKGFDLQRDITFVFADGSKRTFEGAYIRFATDNGGGEATEGENTVTTINTFGIKKQYTMTCYPATYFIKKVEISNLDKYLKGVKYYSEDDYSFDFYGTEDDTDGVGGETVTVTFNDGTTQTKEFYMYEPIIVETAYGSEIYLYYGEAMIDGEICFAVVTSGENILLKEKIEVTEATAVQNIKRLGERIGEEFSAMVNSVKFWFNVMTNPEEYPYYTIAEAMIYLLDRVFSRLGSIVEEIGDCCEHLILG